MPPFLICKKVESDGDWQYADGLTDDCLNACALAGRARKGQKLADPSKDFFPEDPSSDVFFRWIPPRRFFLPSISRILGAETCF